MDEGDADDEALLPTEQDGMDGEDHTGEELEWFLAMATAGRGEKPTLRRRR